MSAAYPWASPGVISQMTLPQLCMYLNKVDSEAMPANAFQSAADRQAYVDEIRARKGQE